MSALGDEVRAAAIESGCAGNDAVGRLVNGLTKLVEWHAEEMRRNVVPVLDERALRLAVNAAVAGAVERKLVLLTNSWAAWAVLGAVALQPAIVVLLLFMVLRG